MDTLEDSLIQEVSGVEFCTLLILHIAGDQSIIVLVKGDVLIHSSGILLREVPL